MVYQKKVYSRGFILLLFFVFFVICMIDALCLHEYVFCMRGRSVFFYNCKKLFGNKLNAKRHSMMHQPVSNLKIEQRTNPNFVDPKSVKILKPPVKGQGHPLTLEQSRDVRRMEQLYKRQLYRFEKEKDFKEKENVDEQLDQIWGRKSQF